MDINADHYNKMIDASTKRNALLGIREVLHAEIHRNAILCKSDESPAMFGIKAEIGRHIYAELQEQERIILECYHKLVEEINATL